MKERVMIMTLNEKVAYLKGLAEGLNLDETKPENKIIKAMMDILDDMALTVTDLEDTVDTLDEYVEELDDDLADVEDIVYDEDEDGEYDEECDDEDGEYDDEDTDEEEEYDDDSEFYEVMCPKCKEVIYLDSTIDPKNITCPNCYEKFDISGDCDGDCNGCSGCGDN